MDNVSLKQSKYLVEYILMNDDPVKMINESINELLIIIPEIKTMIGFEHKHPHHHLDVWNHTLLAISKSPKDFIIRIALLLHDIGKPICYQEGDVRHFKGHPNVSALLTNQILTRLEYDKQFIDIVCKLIEMHDTPISDKLIEEDKNFSLKLYEIQKCDALAHHPDKLEKRIKYLEELEEKLFKDKIKKYN